MVKEIGISPKELGFDLSTDMTRIMWLMRCYAYVKTKESESMKEHSAQNDKHTIRYENTDEIDEMIFR